MPDETTPRNSSPAQVAAGTWTRTAGVFHGEGGQDQGGGAEAVGQPDGGQRGDSGEQALAEQRVKGPGGHGPEHGGFARADAGFEQAERAAVRDHHDDAGQGCGDAEGLAGRDFFAKQQGGGEGDDDRIDRQDEGGLGGGDGF